MWKVIIPTLPLLFLVAPGLWRNLCPLAASNQTPRALKHHQGADRAELAEGIRLRDRVQPVRRSSSSCARSASTTAAPLSALLLLGAMTAAFAGGMLLKGKSGWCSTICPLLPVQRIYGQTPFALVANSHCQPCVGCAKNCYDFNPRAAYLADLHDADNYWSGYRRFFVGAFPGLVLGFFAVPDGPKLEIVGGMALYVAGELASLRARSTRSCKRTPHTLTSLFGAVAFSLFYWYAGDVGPSALDVGDPRRRDRARGDLVRAHAAQGEAVPGAGRRRPPRPRQPGRSPRSRARAARRAPAAPEVTFVPREQARRARSPALRCWRSPRPTACRSRPAAGWASAAPTRSRSRSGMDCTSPISDDEQRHARAARATPPNTRMACCARSPGRSTVALTPGQGRGAGASARSPGFNYDRGVKRVVVIGNGIAGVDRRRPRAPPPSRRPTIDLIAEEPHHLYNRMGICRLVYGRSAMQGLYLNPDAWYDEREITTWLNTRALWIDRADGEVALGTGERLPYDRLILATGSRSFVPPIEGFGAAGTGVLRTAADAMALRAYAQRVGCRRARRGRRRPARPRGRLRAAQARPKTPCSSARRGLLRRQLDARAAASCCSRTSKGSGSRSCSTPRSSRADASGRLRAVRPARRPPARGRRSCSWPPASSPTSSSPATPASRQPRRARRRRACAPSDPDILAAGDVAEFAGQVPGLWPTAVAQAEVAAENAAGGDKVYEPAVPVTILKVVGIELASHRPLRGRRAARGGDRRSRTRGRYRKLVIADGRIVGAILLGHGNDVAAVRTAITRGFDVTAQLDALRAGRWDVLAELSGGSRSSRPPRPETEYPRHRRRPDGHAAENPPPARRRRLCVLAVPAAANAAVTPDDPGQRRSRSPATTIDDNITLGVNAAGLLTHNFPAAGFADNTDFDPASPAPRRRRATTRSP